MDVFKRSLAPITDAAWEEIVDEATDTLKMHLSARRVVDVLGPHGMEHAAVSLGRLDLPKQEKDAPVQYGIRQVQPLVEVRARFELDIWELDNIARGAKDLDLDAVVRAAREAARFEEQAIYNGFPDAGITGLAKAGEHKPVKLGDESEEYPDLVATAVLTLQSADVKGPYTLVLGPKPYRLLERGCGGYPIRRRVEDLLGGGIVFAPFVGGGFLVSRRGGDMELTLGHDFELGYETHDSRTVRLFLSESFTFRVLDPESFVPLVMGS